METKLYTDRHVDLVERCKLGERKAQLELYIHQFRQQSTFGAWLKQIVVNKAINQLRSRKMQWVQLEEWQAADGAMYGAEDSYDSGEDTVYEVERIRHTMQQLPEGYRVVLNLYLFEGYDHEEIGEVLGISEVTSRTQYMRAKRKLVEMMK